MNAKLEYGTARPLTEAFHARYKRPDWKSLRWEVLTRSEGICEECHQALAAHVHHLTYERFGTEQLADLVHLCIDCHQAKHSGRNVKEIAPWQPRAEEFLASRPQQPKAKPTKQAKPEYLVCAFCGIRRVDMKKLRETRKGLACKARATCAMRQGTYKRRGKPSKTAPTCQRCQEVKPSIEQIYSAHRTPPGWYCRQCLADMGVDTKMAQLQRRNLAKRATA